MRKLIFAAALLVSVAALAQEKKNSFYVFVSDPQYVWTESNGSDFNAGLLIFRNGERHEFERITKLELADRVLDLVKPHLR